VLDLSWVHAELAPYYSHFGRPSIDPELMIRMLILGYVFAIRSERLLCREVQVNLAYRWFCGLSIEVARRQKASGGTRPLGIPMLLRCHMQAFAGIGGVPIEILYDRMKTAVTGEDRDGHIIYNGSLLTLARHYGFQPKACRPYRAKTKGKVERPFSYIRQDFFLARTFRRTENYYLPGSSHVTWSSRPLPR